MDEVDHKELAKQLRQPEGEEGKEVALALNETNSEMIGRTLQALQVIEGQVVLELGPGNGAHIPAFVEQTKPARFIGLDISTTMVAETTALLSDHTSNTEFDFVVYDGLTIPLEDSSVDKVVTVNTLYFWENPVDLLNELFRVLKPGGKLVIAYIQKEAMKDRPFVQYGFTMYNSDDVQQLVVDSDFKSVEIQDLHDEVTMPDGEQMSRDYSLAIIDKPT